MTQFTRVGSVFPLLILLILGLSISHTTAITQAQDIRDTLPDMSGMTIYFSEAYGEASRFDREGSGISRFAGIFELAGADIFTLEWRDGIPDDVDLLVIINAQAGLSVDNVVWLWDYMKSGGRLLLLADPFDYRGRFDRTFRSTGFFSVLWDKIGLRGRSDIIVNPGEMQSIDVRDTTSDGTVVFEFSGAVPVLEFSFFSGAVNGDHPITRDLFPAAGDTDVASDNLDQLFFNGARSFDVDVFPPVGDVTPLIFVDDSNLYSETDYGDYANYGYSHIDLPDDRLYENVILGVAYEDEETGMRLVSVGDGDFALNGGGFQTSPLYTDSFVYPANVQFLVNAALWLLELEPVPLDFATPAATTTATVTATATSTARPTPTVFPTATPAD